MQKKKSGVKKCLEICAIKGGGGGGGRLMANAILNFHFDYPHPSLIEFSEGSDEEERGDVGGDKRHNHCARLTHDKVNIERKMDLEIVV